VQPNRRYVPSCLSFALYSPPDSSSLGLTFHKSRTGQKLCKQSELESANIHAKMQTTLFGASAATNGFRDSSFAKNKNLPLHRWVPWVAGFSADFVEDAIRKYLPAGDSRCWVLDPFAGVGTTLVESYLGGLNVIGFEINPYAALATKIKLSAMRISVPDLTRRISAFERFMEKAESGALKREPRSTAPVGFSGRTQLFSPKVERKVLYALDFINPVEGQLASTASALGS